MKFVVKKIINKAKSILEYIFRRGPFIVKICRYGEPYDLWRQSFRRRAMMEKINRNIIKMGGYQVFKGAITKQRDEAALALGHKMKKWYTLQKQVEFLNEVKLGN